MTSEAQLKKFVETRKKIHGWVHSEVVGYDDVVDDLLIGLLSNGHILLEGVPGIAKTTLVKTFTSLLDLEFKRIQFTQDLLPADITGHYYYDQKKKEFAVRLGPIFGNTILADELNRAPPKTQSALLEAMQEHQATIEGTTYPLPEPFMVIATLNPIDSHGVYSLPEAELDRFTMRVSMSYLPAKAEKEFLRSRVDGTGIKVTKTNTKSVASFVTTASKAVQTVTIHDKVLDYLHTIGMATRDHGDLQVGASPRAMEHLLAASRARAVLEGRDYVIPDDVKSLASKVLCHRLILEPDAEIEGRTVEAALNDILQVTPVPKGLKAPRA